MNIDIEKTQRDITDWYAELLNQLDTEVKTERLRLILRRRLESSRDKDLLALHRATEIYNTVAMWKLGKKVDARRAAGMRKVDLVEAANK